MDADGATQLPEGIVTSIEYRAATLSPVQFQVYRAIDILTGHLRLVYTIQLQPHVVGSVTRLDGLSWRVQNKDRWGFSYGANDQVPLTYDVTLNSPNREPYMGFESLTGAAVDLAVGGEVQFGSDKVQKQFMIRACMRQYT